MPFLNDFSKVNATWFDVSLSSQQATHSGEAKGNGELQRTNLCNTVFQ